MQDMVPALWLLTLQALRRDLLVLEKEAGSYGALVADSESWPAPDLLKQLEGRFHFLWGIYRAHSEVIPASAGYPVFMTLWPWLYH